MAKIKHIEFAATDGAKLKSFYAGLFGWKIQHRDMGGFDYYDIDLGGEPSAGIRDEPMGEAETVVYVEVDDVEEAVEKARSLGAEIRIEPMEYGDLKFALINDPEGNPVGLTQAE